MNVLYSRFQTLPLPQPKKKLSLVVQISERGIVNLYLLSSATGARTFMNNSGECNTKGRSHDGLNQVLGKTVPEHLWRLRGKYHILKLLLARSFISEFRR